MPLVMDDEVRDFRQQAVYDVTANLIGLWACERRAQRVVSSASRDDVRSCGRARLGTVPANSWAGFFRDRSLLAGGRCPGTDGAVCPAQCGSGAGDL